SAGLHRPRRLRSGRRPDRRPVHRPALGRGDRPAGRPGALRRNARAAGRSASVDVMRVAVVGCGLIGAAVARELQRRGARTIVYEADHPGAGTSKTTFAWINSHDKEPRAYHDLNVAGMEAHLRLQAEAGAGEPWLFP